MNDYRFLQQVHTPMGPATYIATMTDGNIQVSRMARFDELSREEIERKSMKVKDMDRDQYRDWLKKATYCKNEIYPAQEVTA